MKQTSQSDKTTA